MYIIQMIDRNFVEEITIEGYVRLCPVDYQAKKFIGKASLKPYTDLLDSKHGKRSYKVLGFTTTTYEVEY